MPWFCSLQSRGLGRSKQGPSPWCRGWCAGQPVMPGQQAGWWGIASAHWESPTAPFPGWEGPKTHSRNTPHLSGLAPPPHSQGTTAGALLHKNTPLCGPWHHFNSNLHRSSHLPEPSRITSFELLSAIRQLTPRTSSILIKMTTRACLTAPLPLSIASFAH